ncbi:MAG: SUMF1/EgtB/PvdO family nonheme iron enzyme [Prevotellaceae bacterium]|jgi:formylglycine-generating enzyme required for sulfatase activity|nr:SUMF1/EgtB/PvdO family nonheme iron enzyme [Prevotellaceae bacterium]
MDFQEFQQRYKYNAAVDRLGGGGFGEVFKAYDTHRDRWVAIKIAKVLPELENVRLKKEAEMVSRLPTHPNIAYYEECYTFSSFDGEYDFGILQYYEEGNLLQLLNKGALSSAQKQAVLKQILNGLDFLHKNGIIHRDLKPHNILIVKRGNEYIPKITDFGISKKLDVGKSSVFSNSLVGAGTLAYSSPEQLADKSIRKNTDLWSFGVIAFQTLSGELPFTTGGHAGTSEAGRQELFRQINGGQFTDKINATPEPWQTLIRRCLDPDADRRIKNCDDCYAVLDGNKPGYEQTPTTSADDTTLESPVSDKTALEAVGKPRQGSDKTTNDKQQAPKPPAGKPGKKKSNASLWIAVAVAIALLLAVGLILQNNYIRSINMANVSLLPDSVSKPPDEERGGSIEFSQDSVSKQTIPSKPHVASQPKIIQKKGGNVDVTQVSDSIARVADAINNSNTQAYSAEPELVFVQGGTFTMGCTSEQGDDCDNNSKPAHQVSLSSFYIGKYEVTQAQWKVVMGNNPSKFKGDNLPVERVNWDDVQEFIKKLNAATRKNYRLPTEAEWEFAARGGNKSRAYKYSGGNDLNKVVWYTDNSKYRTHAVGSKSPNELGIYDMSGNIWEWCGDWYGAYSISAQQDPVGASSGSSRVIRGGGWSDYAAGCSVAFRYYNNPSNRYNYLGFRMVLPKTK